MRQVLIRMRSSFDLFTSLSLRDSGRRLQTVYTPELGCTGSQCPEGVFLSVTHNYLCHLKGILPYSQPPKQRSIDQSPPKECLCCYCPTQSFGPVCPVALWESEHMYTLDGCLLWIVQISSFFFWKPLWFLLFQICLGLSSCKLWGAPSHWAWRMSGWALGKLFILFHILTETSWSALTFQER